MMSFVKQHDVFFGIKRRFFCNIAMFYVWHHDTAKEIGWCVPLLKVAYHWGIPWKMLA